jgi:hypothetical protein
MIARVYAPTECEARLNEHVGELNKVITARMSELRGRVCAVCNRVPLITS